MPKKMQCVVLLLFLCSIKSVENGRIFRDPDLLAKIPDKLKRQVDSMIKTKINQILSVHFDENNNLIPSSATVPFARDDRLEPVDRRTRVRADESFYGTEDNLHHRSRRAVNDTVAVYSEWSDFGECSVKCGGGVRVRTRECLQGNCTTIGAYMESAECGHLPCVSGTYILDGMNAIWNIPFQDTKVIKFFVISERVFLGYITKDQMFVHIYDYALQRFNLTQQWPVTDGISFTLLDTKTRVYMVVIEKSISVFSSRFSRMYVFDPFIMRFDTTQPVQFDVVDPSVAIGFQVYGHPFMALVNKRSNPMSPFAAKQQSTICNGKTETLSCPAGTHIRISKVTYGRLNHLICNSDQNFNSDFVQSINFCFVPGVKNRVVSQCENKKSCTVTASPSSLISGFDNCAQLKKYLVVSFTCNTVSYMSQPLFYRWDGVGLSMVRSENLVTYGAQDLEAFNIHNNAYVAVANYINDQQSHHLDSEVYFYNLDTKRFQSLQKLRTDGAIDLEFFIIGQGLAQEYFLAVANHVKVFPNGKKTYELNSVIYKWNWNLFVPFQCIRTYGAKKWTAVTGQSGEFLLAVSNLFGRVTFYSYNGWRFYEAKIQPQGDIFEKASGTYFASFVTSPGKPKQNLLMVRNENRTFSGFKNIYFLEFKKTFPQYELLESTLKAVQKLNRTVYEGILTKAKVFNASYNAVKDDIVFIDDFVNITGKKTFDKLNVLGTTTVTTANTSQVQLSPSDVRYKQRQDDVNNTLDRHKSTILDIRQYLNRAVTKTTPQNITSPKIFTNGVNFEKAFVKHNVEVSSLVNNIRLSALNTTALFVNQDAEISGTITFESDTSIKADVVIKETINEISFDDVVTINKEQNITGIKTFGNIAFIANTSKEVTVKGLVNGIDMLNLMRLDKDQTILVEHSYVREATLEKDLVISGSINGMNISKIAAETLMKNKGGVVTAYKTFSKLEIDGDLKMAELKTINSVDVSELRKNGVFLNANDYFDQTLTFHGNVTFQNVTLGGSVNQQNISNVVFSDQPVAITALMEFNNNVTVNETLTVNGSINGLDFPGNVLNTFSDQTITGNKTFHHKLVINADLLVNGLIDSVNLTKIQSTSMLMNKTQTITGAKTFGSLKTSNVMLLNCTADCELLESLRNLTTNTARYSNQTIAVKGVKRFLNGLSVTGNVVAGSINDIAFPGNFLVQGAAQTVVGTTHFENNVTFLSEVFMSEFNEYNLTELYERVLRTVGDHTVTGNFVFSEEVTFNNLNVTGKVDGVNLADIAYTNQNLTFESQKTFQNKLFIDHLSTYSMAVKGFIDGLNLTVLKAELVTLSGDKIIKGKKTFNNHVSFAGNWSIKGLIDGVNITELVQNAMRIDKSQVVTGRKTFVEPVHIDSGNVRVDGLVDGVNLTNLSKQAVKINEPTLNFYGSITCHNITINGNVTVAGLINNVNLTELVSDSLLKNGDQAITGIHHVANLTSRDSMEVEQLVNGFNFTEELVDLANPGAITGHKHFPNGFTANDLQVNGFINGINITRFKDRVVFTNQDAYISGRTAFGADLVVEDNLNERGLINGVNWTLLTSTTLSKTLAQNITVPTELEVVVFEADTQLDGLLNTQDLKDFSENVVYKCVGLNLPITGSHVYQNIRIEGTSELANITLYQGTLDGVDVTKMVDEAVKKTGAYTVYGRKNIKIINADSILASTVNGFKLPEDFVRLNQQQQVITANKIFQSNVYINTNVSMETGATVNGVDISELGNNIIKNSESHTITSAVKFNRGFTLQQNLQSSSVNRVNVSRQKLLLKSGNQTVTGNKHVGQISTDLDVITRNHINGFDLKAIEKDTILSNRRNLISGKKTIDGNVVVKGNLESNLVAGRDVSTLFTGLTKISNILNHDLNTFNRTIKLHNEIISQLAHIILDIHQSLDYFIAHEEIQLPYRSISLDVFTSVATKQTWLIAGAHSGVKDEPCANTSVYYKASSESTFTEHSQFLSSAVSGVKFFTVTDSIYYITASSKVNDGCHADYDTNKSYGIAYKYNNTTNQFEISFKLETSGSSQVDAATSGTRVFTAFSGLYSSSDPSVKCVLSTLYTYDLSKQQNDTVTYTATDTATNTSCNIVKTIIISVSSHTVTVGILASSLDSVKQFNIYQVDVKNQSNKDKFTLLQSISTFHVGDVINFDTKFGKFLVIANTYDFSPESLSVFYNIPVVVLKFNEDTGKFQKYQEFDVFAAQIVRHFVIGSYDYLAIATFDQKVVILKHKGVSKWQEELTVPTQGLGQVKDLTFWMDSSNDLYMAILTEDAWNEAYPSKIRIVKAEFTSDVDGEDIVGKLQMK